MECGYTPCIKLEFWLICTVACPVSKSLQYAVLLQNLILFEMSCYVTTGILHLLTVLVKRTTTTLQYNG